MKHTASSSRRCREEKLRAFTLVELLAVIAIIAILAALLFPFANKALAASRQAKCTANLRGIGNLLAIYASDNNGITVSSYNSESLNWSVIVANGTRGNVATSSLPKDVWRCPENKKQFFEYESDEQGERACSYTINGFFDEVSHPLLYSAENRYTANRMANFSHPSKTYAVFEGTYYRSQVGGGGYDMVRWPHGNSMNILFVDGHVESLKKPTDGQLPGFGNYQGATWPDGNNKADAWVNGEKWFAN